MELSRIYKFVDNKYSPIVGYLSISPLEEIKETLIAISNNHGIMMDFFGYEFEENKTLTFYDFSSNKEKSINVSTQEFIDFIEPLMIQYLDKYMNDKDFIKGIIKKIECS